MMEMAKDNRRALAIELAIVTAGVLVVARALFLMRSVALIGQAIPMIVAILLIYAPIAALWIRRRPVDFLDGSARAYGRSLLAFLAAALILFPLFLLAAHGWLVVVAGLGAFHAAGIPNFWGLLAAQLLLVALPEEFFFRGYFQSTMDRIFAKRWCLFGASLGWGWLITAFVFAFAHSLFVSRWWHFAIFFPALAFGYLRERTGSITAPVLFHAACNLLMDWIVRSHLPV